MSEKMNSVLLVEDLERFYREGGMEVDVDLTREDCSFIDCDSCRFGDTCYASAKVKKD